MIQRERKKVIRLIILYAKFSRTEKVYPPDQVFFLH